jgi:hypothetical protein
VALALPLSLLEHAMGVQFERITYASRHSLSLIVDDIARHQREPASPAGVVADLDGWLNALHRQAAPLVSSKAGKTDLLAWLDAVDELLPAAE